jgi:F0F1-type ATP synthase assembly protein I
MNQAPGSGRSLGPLRYAGLGIQLAVSIVLGVLAGQWLDRKAGTDGVFALVGAFLGLGSTFYSLVRDLSKDNKGGS